MYLQPLKLNCKENSCAHKFKKSLYKSTQNSRPLNRIYLSVPKHGMNPFSILRLYMLVIISAYLVPPMAAFEAKTDIGDLYYIVSCCLPCMNCCAQYFLISP